MITLLSLVVLCILFAVIFRAVSVMQWAYPSGLIAQVIVLLIFGVILMSILWGWVPVPRFAQ